MKRKVAIISYDGLCWFEFGIACEFFALKRDAYKNWYRTNIVSADPTPKQTSYQMQYSAPFDTDIIKQADLIVIPGWPIDKTPCDEVLHALKIADQNGAQFAAICSGVFCLANSGLINGKKVTTHWQYADLLAQQNPDIHVNPNALYIHDGNISTSAGSSAGIDLCLSIVKADYGAKIANQVANRLVIAAHREGDQSQHIEQAVQNTRGGKLAPILDQLKTQINLDWDVAKIANLAQMSERSLQRKFKQITNLSAMNWVLNERLILAKSLLEDFEYTLDEVAMHAGFSSTDLFRLHFKRRYKLAPSHYRKKLL